MLNMQADYRTVGTPVGNTEGRFHRNPWFGGGAVPLDHPAPRVWGVSYLVWWVHRPVGYSSRPVAIRYGLRSPNQGCAPVPMASFDHGGGRGPISSGPPDSVGDPLTLECGGRGP